MQLLGLVSTTLAHHKIPYFIDGGTLLGSLREGEMIHHDDDVDIGVLHEYWPRILRLLDVFNGLFFPDPSNPERGYPVATKVTSSIDKGHSTMIKVYLNDNDLWVRTSCPDTGQSRIIGTPTLDIFPWSRKGEKVVLADHVDRVRFPNCYHLKKDLFPLKTYYLGDPEAPLERVMTVSGPRNGLPYLRRYYGPDCLTVLRADERLEHDPINKNRGLPKNISL